MTRPEYKSTLQQIVATKVPAQTTRYKPVSHSQLIDLTLGGI
jgi:hypothetical protein